MVQARIVRSEQVQLIRGAGVCTTTFAPQAKREGIEQIAFGPHARYGFKEFLDPA